jgi:acetyl-CoA carboxylase carboxyltransferase component
VVPVNPRQAYDVRSVISLLVDPESLLELRSEFAPNLVTAFGAGGGLAVAVVANQPCRMAGAIDSNASDKMSRFVQLADAYGVPLVFLVDTPGFMVGPSAEESGLVRHSARALQSLGEATVPLITVVLRKAYGLAYYVMGSPPFGPVHAMAWPSAEFGGMGLTGAANVGRRATHQDPEHSREQHAADLRDDHTVWRVGARYAIDEIIDPADTRNAVHRILARQPHRRDGHPIKRHGVPAW